MLRCFPVPLRVAQKIDLPVLSALEREVVPGVVEVVKARDRQARTGAAIAVTKWPHTTRRPVHHTGVPTEAIRDEAEDRARLLLRPLLLRHRAPAVGLLHRTPVSAATKDDNNASEDLRHKHENTIS